MNTEAFPVKEAATNEPPQRAPGVYGLRLSQAWQGHEAGTVITSDTYGLKALNALYNGGAGEWDGPVPGISQGEAELRKVAADRRARQAAAASADPLAAVLARLDDLEEEADEMRQQIAALEQRIENATTAPKTKPAAAPKTK